ncbi:MAG TPA: hypothetical protein VK698_32085 [Kofleriaceae bacterium]|nr:hypothetical protein [Kofleriaceae bacterium]
MRFPMTDQLLAEAERFQLRCACRDCRHQDTASGACRLGWPNQDQRRWPLDAPERDGSRPTEVQFCKEFELA